MEYFPILEFVVVVFDTGVNAGVVVVVDTIDVVVGIIVVIIDAVTVVVSVDIVVVNNVFH
jgi:hypothetical protein